MRRKRKSKWIQGAIKRPGALRRVLGVPKGAVIPVATLRRAAKKRGKIGQRARFALFLRGLRKGQS